MCVQEKKNKYIVIACDLNGAVNVRKSNAKLHFGFKLK